MYKKYLLFTAFVYTTLYFSTLQSSSTLHHRHPHLKPLIIPEFYYDKYGNMKIRNVKLEPSPTAALPAALFAKPAVPIKDMRIGASPVKAAGRNDVYKPLQSQPATQNCCSWLLSFFK